MPDPKDMSPLEYAFAIASEETSFIIMVTVNGKAVGTYGPIRDRDIIDVAKEILSEIYGPDHELDPIPVWEGGYSGPEGGVEWFLWFNHAPDDRALVGTLRYQELGPLPTAGLPTVKYRYEWDTDKAEGVDFAVFIEPLVRWVPTHR